MVRNVPTYWIPVRCKHADMLKNILVNCKNFPFACSFHHVAAHQDDSTPFHLLDRVAQLNCLMDEKAKAALRKLSMDTIQLQQQDFHMEPILIFAGKEKVTSDSGSLVRFWAHRQLARSFFVEKKILDTEAFDLVDWKAYYAAMHAVPRLFQLWACKQTMGIAATNLARARFTEGLSKLCPSCQVEEEPCGHILKCNERGRVEALKTLVGLLDRWMAESNTEPRLHHVLGQYDASRGTLSV